MSAAQTTGGRWSVPHAAAVGALVCVLALAAAFLAPPAWRSGLLVGVGAAALSLAAALPLMAMVARRPLNDLLAAMAAAFLVRMTLIAAGVVLLKRMGGNPLAFVGAFFPLFFVFIFLELRVAVPSRAASAHADGGAADPGRRA